jgi:hypothetical protein
LEDLLRGRREASGDVSMDTLVLGGVSVKNQSIGLASKLSAQFVESQGDGLLGPAFGPLNRVQPTLGATPVQEDIPRDAELFTAYLANESGNSFYTSGYVEQDALSGQTPS